MKVKFTPRARLNLAEIFEYIATDSPEHAAWLVSEIIMIAGQLAQFPESGHIIAKYSNSNLRERIYQKYRIAYPIKAEVVEVLAIRHVARLSSV